MEKELARKDSGFSDVSELLFMLIHSEISDESDLPDLKDKLTSEIISSLYRLACKHDVAHIVSSALYKLGVLGEDKLSSEIIDKQMLAVYRCENIKYVAQEVYSVFEKCKIKYVPLKGAVMRSLYPEEWLRTSCDIDILIHREDVDTAVTALKERCGYTTDNKMNYHDVSLYSPSGVHLELHFSLNEHTENIDRLLSLCWDYAYQSEQSEYRYNMTNEYFVFHHIAHMSYHFINGGCGVKPFIDLSIIQSKLTYDEKSLREYCKQCELEKFYDNAMYLAQVWFGNKKHTEISHKMEEYVLSGGVYGSAENKIVVSRIRKGGKLKYAYSRLLAPYDILSVKYPILKKHKWLTPIMQVRRWGDSLFSGRAKRALKAEKSVQSTYKNDVGEMQHFLSEIGL